MINGIWAFNPVQPRTPYNQRGAPIEFASVGDMLLLGLDVRILPERCPWGNPPEYVTDASDDRFDATPPTL